MRVYDPALSHFDLDMERGRQGELWIENIRKALSEYSALIEVKTDFWYPISERFYIEYQCRGRDMKWRPSGIETTRAALWAIVWGAHAGMTVVEVAWLRRAVERAREDLRNHISMDYGENPTRGILVYMPHILKTRDPEKDEHIARVSPNKLRRRK
jgi:hypothetical protein